MSPHTRFSPDQEEKQKRKDSRCTSRMVASARSPNAPLVPPMHLCVIVCGHLSRVKGWGRTALQWLFFPCQNGQGVANKTGATVSAAFQHSPDRCEVESLVGACGSLESVYGPCEGFGVEPYCKLEYRPASRKTQGAIGESLRGTRHIRKRSREVMLIMDDWIDGRCCFATSSQIVPRSKEVWPELGALMMHLLLFSTCIGKSSFQYL